MLPLHLQIACEKQLSEKFSKPVQILHFSWVSGGCINKAGKITTGQGDYFVKWNEATTFPGMFELEAKGLQLLGAAHAIQFPRVTACGETASSSFLLLEFIASSGRQSDFWEQFGIQLARLHQNTSGRFGLDHDNYIGSLPQSNRFHDDWAGFFIEERLQKQITLARDQNTISQKQVQQFERLFQHLPSIFPDEKPALVHGDLWNGNYITGEDGYTCLVDPSTHYGNREAELAFTRLFGGFDNEFYRAYHLVFPLQKGFEQRVDIYNLYPLLVHVNLFGGGYLSSVNDILRKF